MRSGFVTGLSLVVPIAITTGVGGAEEFPVEAFADLGGESGGWGDPFR